MDTQQHQPPALRMSAFLRLTARGRGLLTGLLSCLLYSCLPRSAEMSFLRPSLIMLKIPEQHVRMAGTGPTTSLASLISVQLSPPTLGPSHGELPVVPPKTGVTKDYVFIDANFPICNFFQIVLEGTYHKMIISN